MEALGVNLGYLLVQILNFAIIFVVLREWVLKPVLGLLERRRETIALGLENARVAAEARENAEKEAEKVLAEARVKATEIVQEATNRAENLQKEMREQAEKDLLKIREGSREEIAQEKNRLYEDIRKQVTSLAIAAAQKLIGDSLIQDESQQHRLVDEFFSGVKGDSVVVLEGKEFKGGKAEVTSALPLTPEERKFVESDILQLSGTETTISFIVDPSILGGLVVRLGDKVVDGSVYSQLQELKQNLQ